MAIEAGERQSLAQAVDGIQTQFHVSDAAIAWLPAAMILVGAVGAVPFGILADRMRRVYLLAGAMAVWGVVVGLNGLATTYVLLFATRLGIGAVEANGPAAVSLLADYYPVRERAKALGLYQSGSLIGAVVGLLGGGIAVSLGGWRWSFLMWVPVAVVVTIAVARLPEPRRGEQDAAADLDLGTAASTGEAIDHGALSHLGVLRALLRIRTLSCALVALTLSHLLLVGLQFWGVEFFKRHHGLGPAAAGGVLAAFGLGAAAGVLAGGFVADRLLARGVVNARVLVVAVSSIGSAAFLVPAFAIPSLAAALPFMVVGGALLTAPLAPGEALLADVVPAELRGRAGTLRSVVRSVAAAGPLIIGVLSDALDLRAAIVLVTPVYAIGGAIMLLATRSYAGDLAAVLHRARRQRAEHSQS